MLRSEQMLNIEKFYNELRELKVMPLCFSMIDGRLEACTGQCACCQFNKGEPDCAENCKKWLFLEYEEPEVDWSKVKVDTPILVRNNEDKEWVNRYFAKFADGKVYAWVSGATSWTVEDEYDVTFWKYAKRSPSSS